MFEHEHPAIFAHDAFLTGEAGARVRSDHERALVREPVPHGELPGYASMQRPQLSSHFHGPWWGNQEPPNPHL